VALILSPDLKTSAALIWSPDLSSASLSSLISLKKRGALVNLAP